MSIGREITERIESRGHRRDATRGDATRRDRSGKPRFREHRLRRKQELELDLCVNTSR